MEPEKARFSGAPRADALAQVIKTVILNIHAVHKHLTLIAVVKSRNERNKGGLSAPVEPIMPTVCPGSMVRSMLLSTASLLVL